MACAKYLAPPCCPCQRACGCADISGQNAKALELGGLLVDGPIARVARGLETVMAPLRLAVNVSVFVRVCVAAVSPPRARVYV
jgi:hypothetical protein